MAQAIENKPFKWIGGNLALDFNNTVDWLGPEESEEELLSSPDRLLAWCGETGLVSERQHQDLLGIEDRLDPEHGAAKVRPDRK